MSLCSGLNNDNIYLAHKYANWTGLHQENVSHFTLQMDEALSMWELESLSESSLAPTTGVQVGESHVAGGWTAGAFLGFLSLCALSRPGSFSIVRLLTCWLRAPKALKASKNE